MALKYSILTEFYCYYRGINHIFEEIARSLIVLDINLCEKKVGKFKGEMLKIRDVSISL